MTLYGLALVSILKAWIVRDIGASIQDVQLAGLISKLGLPWARTQRNRGFRRGTGTNSVKNIHNRT